MSETKLDLFSPEYLRLLRKLGNPTVTVTAQYPDGDEVVLHAIARDDLQADFLGKLLMAGLAAKGLGAGVQITRFVDGRHVGSGMRHE